MTINKKKYDVGSSSKTNTNLKLAWFKAKNKRTNNQKAREPLGEIFKNKTIFCKKNNWIEFHGSDLGFCLRMKRIDVALSICKSETFVVDLHQ